MSKTKIRKISWLASGDRSSSARRFAPGALSTRWNCVSQVHRMLAPRPPVSNFSDMLTLSPFPMLLSKN